MATTSELRRTKNEIFAQKRNLAVVRQVTKLAPGNLDADISLEFSCECSDLNCTDRVLMPIAEYRSLTSDPARFVISPHHQQPDIEVVLDRTDDHTVVEKRHDLIQQANS